MGGGLKRNGQVVSKLQHAEVPKKEKLQVKLGSSLGFHCLSQFMIDEAFSA